jgi:hypothetical protein
MDPEILNEAASHGLHEGVRFKSQPWHFPATVSDPERWFVFSNGDILNGRTNTRGDYLRYSGKWASPWKEPPTVEERHKQLKKTLKELTNAIMELPSISDQLKEILERAKTIDHE